VPGKTGCRTISCDEFAHFIQSRDFRGNAPRVFRAILAEGPVHAVTTGLTNGQISLAQLKRFSRRKSVVDAAVVSSMDRQAALGERFAKLLKLQHGTVLRGWRMDVDLRGTGSVDMHEFRRACERLGLASKATDIWSCFRPVASDALPLVLQDISKEESMQVEIFINALTKKVNFDLDSAWCILDSESRGYVSLAEFEIGVRRLGFRGDAQFLFRGLDTAGLGKLWQHELGYLKVLCQPEPQKRKLAAKQRASSARMKKRPAWDAAVDMSWRIVLPWGASLSSQVCLDLQGASPLR